MRQVICYISILATGLALASGLVTCWIVIIFFLSMIVVLALEEDTRQALMISPIWFILLIIGYFGFYKQKHK